MIILKDQYVVQFSIGTEIDFIKDEDFIDFSVIEEAGNILPTYEINFFINQDKYLKLFNEGNDFKVTLGKTLDETIEISLMITKVEMQRVGDTKRQINLVGILSKPEYNINPNLQITAEKSAVEVITEIAESVFDKVTSNVFSSSDKQRWIQPNVSNKFFVNDLWLHADIPNSFLGIGICADSTFIMKDIKKSLLDGYKYKLQGAQSTNIVPTGTDVVIDPDWTFKSNTGFLNFWLGYGREKQVINMETGVESIVSEEISTIIAQSSNLMRRSDLEKRKSNIGALSENCHANYWSAYQRNLQSLAVFSSIELVVSITNQFQPYNLLDLVMFNDKEADNPNVTTESHSGLYFITRIARTFTNNQIATLLTLNREGLNSTKGNLN